MQGYIIYIENIVVSQHCIEHFIVLCILWKYCIVLSPTTASLNAHNYNRIILDAQFTIIANNVVIHVLYA